MLFKSPKPFALALATTALLAFTVPEFVDARPSGSKSSGSRGSRSNDSVPATNTAPRTQQQGAPNQTANRAAAPAPAPSMMSRLGPMLMGGLIGAGLFGLFSGAGFGGLGGMLSMLFQVLLIGGLAYLAFRFFRKKQEPALAGMPNSMSRDMNYQPAQPMQGGYTPQPTTPVRERSDDVGIVAEDYNAFETILTKVQDAYGREALTELKPLVTAEMHREFSDTVAENTRNGIHNACGGAKLLQGDLAESWSENGQDYATVTLKYALFDVTKSRSNGAVIDGSMTTPIEVIEHWTFVRAANAGQTWVLSGIDQA